MAKYNTAGVRTAKPPVAKAAPAGVIGTKKSGKPATTFEGHDGFERKDKSALFLLAAGSLGGEDTFYESGTARTQRLVDLVRKVALKDPQWTAAFLGWLRTEGNIRTASVVGAVEAADALAKAGVPGGRQIVASVLQRADEPGEAMAYWLATRKGPKGERVIMPISIKRGIADAVGRLYTEFSFLKYDSDRAAVRFGDVIEMVHPAASRSVAEKIFREVDEASVSVEAEDMASWLVDQGLRRDQKINQWMVRTGDLFRYAIEKRHGRGTAPADSLGMIRRQAEWFALAKMDLTPDYGLLDSDRLRGAGITWEDAMSALGSRVDKGKIWKAMLPNLGYMALIRNLRNLDEAKVPDKDVAEAIARIQDPEQVATSRQLPFRFYSAYLAAPSLRWGHALDMALNASLKNIPTLGGRTLILIDTSASMTYTKVSDRSERMCEEIAGIFGLALGLKGEADIYGWADSPWLFQAKGTSVLKNLEKFMSENGKTGHGTDLAAAIKGTYVPGKYSRMVVISDGQAKRFNAGLIPTDIPCYFFNLAGYAPAPVETKGMVYELGGLTDHTFKMITMLEAGDSGKWPWE